MRDYLKKLRLDKGMTMAAVAEAFGITPQYYEMIESGERQKKMDITLIAKIADLFGVSLETIVSEETKLIEQKQEETA